MKLRQKYRSMVSIELSNHIRFSYELFENSATDSVRFDTRSYIFRNSETI